MGRWMIGVKRWTLIKFNHFHLNKRVSVYTVQWTWCWCACIHNFTLLVSGLVEILTNQASIYIDWQTQRGNGSAVWHLIALNIKFKLCDVAYRKLRNLDCWQFNLLILNRKLIGFQVKFIYTWIYIDSDSQRIVHEVFDMGWYTFIVVFFSGGCYFFFFFVWLLPTFI